MCSAHTRPFALALPINRVLFLPPKKPPSPALLVKTSAPQRRAYRRSDLLNDRCHCSKCTFRIVISAAAQREVTCDAPASYQTCFIKKLPQSLLKCTERINIAIRKDRMTAMSSSFNRALDVPAITGDVAAPLLMINLLKTEKSKPASDWQKWLHRSQERVSMVNVDDMLFSHPSPAHLRVCFAMAQKNQSLFLIWKLRAEVRGTRCRKRKTLPKVASFHVKL